MALVQAGMAEVLGAPAVPRTRGAAAIACRPPLRVSLRGLAKSFRGTRVVAGLDLEVGPGEVLALAGPSGCGKSTTLRLVAGLADADGGEVWIGNAEATHLPPKARDIAMVFQTTALYPHLTVYRNLALPLELRKLPRVQVERRVEAIAERLDITYLLNRKPRLLSGGQRQLASLARALVRRPSLLLLDEPFSNLDAKCRAAVRAELARLRAEQGTTAIYVGHDQADAMAVADRVAVMREGRIEQVGTPAELLDDAASTFVATFIGLPGMNLLPARLDCDGAVPCARLGKVALPSPGYAGSAGASRDLLLGLRPQWFSDRPLAGGAAIETIVRTLEPAGAAMHVTLESDAGTFVATLPSDRRPRPGDRLMLWADMARAQLFDPGTGRAIPRPAARRKAA
jgi:multiple sugar transport system ATP-binding protein